MVGDRFGNEKISALMQHNICCFIGAVRYRPGRNSA